MSQHPSLRLSSAGKKHRNVLKRHERIEKLKSQSKWNSEANSPYGLPKVKSQKLKAKSSKAEKEEATEEKKA